MVLTKLLCPFLKFSFFAFLRAKKRSKNLIHLGLKYVVALPFLISEWSGFLRSARRFKSYDRFRKEGHEGLTPNSYVLYKAKWGQKSPKNGYF